MALRPATLHQSYHIHPHSSEAPAFVHRRSSSTISTYSNRGSARLPPQLPSSTFSPFAIPQNPYAAQAAPQGYPAANRRLSRSNTSVPHRPNHHRSGSDISILPDGSLVHLDDPTPEAARARTSRYAMKPKRCNTSVSLACSELEMRAAEIQAATKVGQGETRHGKSWLGRLKGLFVAERRIVTVTLRWDRPYYTVPVPEALKEFEKENGALEDISNVDVLLGYVTMDSALGDRVLKAVRKSFEPRSKFPIVVEFAEVDWTMVSGGEKEICEEGQKEYLEYIIFLLACLVMREMEE
ncbi:hypothetical protein BJ508DRAFT_327460 [Ascobolus immersus RN42]|uniref:Uncharacterized protein n=1 Tax=Ascobolus immersus RN42 TaxID=1160509 RepID=A0A3N4I2M4_ASCIM|nr:hypothetical protein BJ508DRAFT_327460 [Ascobolus immersus RN42]